MSCSPLARYVTIINALAQFGPLKMINMNDILYPANVNSVVLKEDLQFLVKQALVEEINNEEGRIVFVVTQRGIKVTKYFGSPKQTITIIQEECAQ
jgi:predicted transcriptional regulator